MPPITFLPSGVVIESQKGETILDAARRAGLSVEVPCGGRGICKKCVVQVLSGDIIREDNPLLSKSMLDDGYAMACKTLISDGSAVRVRLLSDVESEHGAFSEQSEDMLLVDPELLPKAGEMAPMTQMTAVRPALPVSGDGLSDYDRFASALADALQAVSTDGAALAIHLPLRLLRALPLIIRQSETLRVAYFVDDGQASVVDIQPLGSTLSNSAAELRVGVALDIGTTTVAMQLVELSTGAILASKTDYNGQIACGLDVISRINYAQKPDRLEELRVKILKTINGLLDDLSEEVSIDPAGIYDMTVAANTTMVHLLLGIPPENIRLDPYVPSVNYVPIYRAGELGIEICPDAPVLIAPSVGSYVGGDISTGLLCTQLAYDSEDIFLFLDIGTNGELILGNNEFLLGCACSAGPAFEGGGITQGMRASMGAIERVAIDAVTGLATYSVIGGHAPKGICGSGMISLVASLMRSGWIDSAGQLDRERECAAIEVAGRQASYIIEPNEGMRVAVSENDIQNIVRAKAAIFSACLLLLQNVGLSFDDLSGMVIAGGFGRYLDIDDATMIGLIPKAMHDKVRFQGNTSVSGANLALVSEHHRKLLDQTAKRITYIDLSTDLGYMDQYSAALFLPHTEESLFK
ncbi:MAG: ASKHA domain-containing protein [Coriobacteriia bacterium]|nr:ASKHA domain-containing protein [Coriobacteriia bacterium]